MMMLKTGRVCGLMELGCILDSRRSDPEIGNHLPKCSKLAPSLGILFSLIMACITAEICGRLGMSAHSAPVRKIWGPLCGPPLDLCRFYGYKTNRTQQKL